MRGEEEGEGEEGGEGEGEGEREREGEGRKGREEGREGKKGMANLFGMVAGKSCQQLLQETSDSRKAPRLNAVATCSLTQQPHDSLGYTLH